MTQTPDEARAHLAQLQAAADKLFDPAAPQAEWNIKPENRREFTRIVEAAVALCKSEGIWEHVKEQIQSETSQLKRN